MNNMIKKPGIYISLIAIIVVAALISSYFIWLKPCDHRWQDATCNTPVTCVRCGETAGTPLGHNWKDPDCVTARTCSACGATEGDPLGHEWSDADCVTPMTCSVCGAVDGDPLGHNWKDATYSAPKTCTVCGATEGSALTRPVNSGSGSSGSSSSGSSVRRCFLCNERLTNSQILYCSMHGCAHSNCPNQAKCKGGNTWGQYCAAHSCQYPDCLSGPIGGSDYCLAHHN